MSTKLTSTQVAAVAKLVNPKDFQAASSELEPGEHDVDFYLHVTGSLKKGEDTVQLREPRADWKRLALKALSKLNEATLRAMVAESMELDDDETQALEERVKPVVKELGQKQEVHCNGAVRAKVLAAKVPTRYVQLPAKYVTTGSARRGEGRSVPRTVQS